MSEDYVKSDYFDAQSRQVTVIVAEDEQLLRVLAVESLSDAGFTVFEVAHAKAVLDILDSEQRIDLLFTDVHMRGDMNGLELAQHVKKHRPEIKLLLVSGATHPEKHELPDGSRFVPKPYKHDHIVRHIRSMVAA